MEIGRTIALQARILINCIVVFYHFQRTLVTAIGSDITVETSVIGTPIRQGEVLAYLCNVQNMQADSGFKVTISRIVSGSSGQPQILALYVNGQTLGNDDDRIFLADRQQDDGSTSYLLSITNADRADEGSYTCLVDSHDRKADYYEETKDIDIQYFPSDSNLDCSPRNSFTVLEGAPYSVYCQTDIGNPPVTIEWTKTGSPDATMITSTSLSNTTVFSTLNKTTTLEDNGAFFMCKFTSTAFPSESSKQCIVGPLQVIPVRKSTRTPGPSLMDSTDGVSKTVGDVKCDSSCSTDPSTLYWIAAGVVAGIIALILLIGDILLIIKLRKLRGTWGAYKAYSLTPSVAETNYMYLPRSALEGNRTYMTLERTDPQQSNYLYSEEIYGPPTPMHYAISPSMPSNDSYTESHV